MSTPKEIIREFREKFTYVEEGFLGNENYVSIRQDITISKLNSALISTVIKQYEEILNEVGNIEKVDTQTLPSDLDIDFDVQMQMRRDMKQFGDGYNTAISKLQLYIQSRLKAWRELRDKK